MATTDVPTRSANAAPVNPLVTLREEYALTQADASSWLGISRSLWAAWETGRRNIRPRHLFDLQVLFDLSDQETLTVLRWTARRFA